MNAQEYTAYGQLYLTEGLTLEVVSASLLARDTPYENACAAIRVRRDALLASTDTWGLADYPATAEQTAYRQALRDITAQTDFPIYITWPTKPE
jgi:hypothetical protein